MNQKIYPELDVLCVGMITSDVMLKPVDPSIFSVDKTHLTNLTYSVGGDAANQSVIFAKLGNRTGIAATPGDDDAGVNVRRYLEQYGVNTDNCVVIPGSRTRTSFVLIHSDGERNLLGYTINCGKLSKDVLDLGQLDHTRMISVGSIFSYDTLDAYLPEYLAEAQKRGVITAADTMSNMNHVPLSDLAGILAHLDYFTPSYVEAQDLTKKDDPDEQADVFFSMGVKNVVIKLGTDGCLIRNAKERYHLPIIPTECIDTTGAGDNFVAGFLTGILKGWDLKKSGTFATAVGSIAIREVGANSSLKNYDQVIEVLKEAGRYWE
ncbi:MAG: carbohydrate kinase family protein [Lachnospiraceae bacterium]|nr:carbohydrate kinase family protein [Lachnospiraceae bacterium]MBQ9593856.1 carbohydrate kinase family protein [Lachnospiraceae bacterium]